MQQQIMKDDLSILVQQNQHHTLKYGNQLQTKFHMHTELVLAGC